MAPSDATTNASSPPKRDPLESPLISIAFFGGVFLVAFLINVIRMLMGLRPAPEPTPDEASPLMMTAGFLLFAIGSGISVAFARRITSAPHKNHLTGALVGAWYTFACWLTFGREIAAGWGLLALLILVFLGVTWAISSGLKEARF